MSRGPEVSDSMANLWNWKKSNMALSIESKQEKVNDETGQVSGDFLSCV